MLSLKQFEQSLRRLFINGPVPGRVVLACSGGLDSMVLLDLMANLFVDYESLVVCYVDHGQRPPAETKKDRDVIRHYCDTRQLRFESKTLSLKKGASELTLRTARYAALAEIAGPKGIVFTAHHAQDDLETYLLKLLRGAHPETIKGIPARSRRGALRLARPLLEFTRAELEAYARQHKLEWSEDSTNSSLKYGRNRVRHELLPLLESLRPQSAGRILKFFKSLERHQPKLDELKTKQVRSELVSGDGADIRQIDFPLLKAVIDQLLAEKSCRTTQSHWFNVQRQLDERHTTKRCGGPEKTLQFPGGNALRFKGNRLFWISPN